MPSESNINSKQDLKEAIEIHLDYKDKIPVKEFYEKMWVELDLSENEFEKFINRLEIDEEYICVNKFINFLVKM